MVPSFNLWSKNVFFLIIHSCVSTLLSTRSDIQMTWISDHLLGKSRCIPAGEHRQYRVHRIFINSSYSPLFYLISKGRKHLIVNENPNWNKFCFHSYLYLKEPCHGLFWVMLLGLKSGGFEVRNNETKRKQELFMTKMDNKWQNWNV